MFLDRDGTLVEEVDFLTRPEELRLIPGAAEAVARLNRAGWAAVLVTNQSAVARGMLTETGLAELTALLEAELARHGARLDGIYACPHHPSEGSAPYRRSCDCRKPAPGLLVRAARELDLDLERSWVVGDSARDLAAGAVIGLPGILVETGKGRAELEELGTRRCAPRCTAPDFAGAVELILAGTRGSG